MLTNIQHTNFWNKVKKTKTCWIWIGNGRNGYGRIKINGKSLSAHRVSWELANGKISENLKSISDFLFLQYEALQP